MTKEVGKIKSINRSGKGVVIAFSDGRIVTGKGLGIQPDVILPDKEYLVVEGDYERLHILEPDRADKRTVRTLAEWCEDCKTIRNMNIAGCDACRYILFKNSRCGKPPQWTDQKFWDDREKRGENPQGGGLG